MVIKKDATDSQKEVIAFRCPNDQNVNEVAEFAGALYITVNCDFRHLKETESTSNQRANYGRKEILSDLPRRRYQLLMPTNEFTIRRKLLRNITDEPHIPVSE